MKTEHPTHQLLKWGGNLARIALLLAVLSGIAVFGIWVFAPQWVTWLDHRLVERYEQKYESRFDQAVQLFNNGKKTQATEELKTLLNDMNSIRKGDRPEGLKAKSFELLTKVLLAEDKPLEALARYEQWIAFDDRNLIAQVGKARVLCTLPERKEEGIRMISDLYRKVPDSLPVAEAYASVLLEQDRLTDAFLSLLNYQRFQRRFLDRFGSYRIRPWEISWDTGSGFNEGQKALLFPVWKEENRMALMAKLPAGFTYRKFKIAAPLQLNLSLSEASFTLVAGSKWERLSDKSFSLHLHEMTREGNVFVTEGNHPSLVLELKEPRKMESASQFVAEGTVEFLVPELVAHFPESFVPLLRDPKKVQRLSDELRSRGETEALAEFYALLRERDLALPR